MRTRRATADRAIDIGAPHRAGEPVLGVVGDRDRLVVVAVAKDREHGSEHLLLGDSGVGVDIGQDRGFVVEAGVQAGWPPSADRQRGAVVERRGDECLDAVALG